MTEAQWQAIKAFREDYKKQIGGWEKRCPELQGLQREACRIAKNPEYSFEVPVVYNMDLDKITRADEIKLIVIGDNPGKDEQLFKNQRYLVGQAGKIAEGYFRRNEELKIDFRKNVIILNKTPVHSAKTNQLLTIKKLGGKAVESLIEETEEWMAINTAKLHKDLIKGAEKKENGPELWLVGYSELREKGIFKRYKEILQREYAGADEWEKVFVFQHFSMNRFSINLEEYCEQNRAITEKMNLMEKIHSVGEMHKREILG